MADPRMSVLKGPRAMLGWWICCFGFRSSRQDFDSSTNRRVRSQARGEEVLGGKEGRFHGDERNAAVLFARLVPGIQEAFTAEDVAFTSLFTLDDARDAVDVYLVPGGARSWVHAGYACFAASTKRANMTPYGDFRLARGGRVGQQGPAGSNDALKSARRQATMDDEDVKGIFIAALDRQRALPARAPCPVCYFMTNARYFMDTDTEERNADADLLEISMDLRKQVKDTAINVKTLSDAASTYCQPVDTSMGGFHIGGSTSHGLGLNKFTDTTAAATVAPPPKTAAVVDAAQSVVSEDDGQMYPVGALHA
ncbi:hypothetical protein CYMTET_10774 [Cymbomonas tetramitiformis]|uniref:Uncharacterized protein n=1 Tax=Cymbomonas tetramitiformis TaxID=36881 RepID=A0AAE0GNM4_9CHLO|nr:hypothetical protein CYMTET_10774 [Cymbomonas tetramitiformis]